MKKIVLFLSIFFALGVVLNSCISEKVAEIIDDPGEPKEPEKPNPGTATKKTFYLRFLPDLEIDSTSINTYAGPFLGGIRPVLSWGDSESAGVFLTGNDGNLLYSNRRYDFTPSSSIYTDTITTSLTTASAFGYIPFQSSASGTTVSYTLDGVQDQSANNSTEEKMDVALEKNVFLISSTSGTFNIDGGIGPMTYKSVFAFLRFQIKRSPGIFDQEKATGVKLYVADTTNIEKSVGYSLAGNFKMDVSKAIGTSGYSGPDFDQSSRIKEITSSVTGGELISESVNSPYVWFVINPIKIKASERLISVVETTSGYKIISKHDISELAPNTVYTSTIEANENNTVSSQILEISNGKRSNCHIAPSAGIYRMYLRKIESGDLLTGTTVEWLWASKEGGGKSFDISELIDPASISYNAASGHVDFRVGTSLGKYTKGNVILALKDANGEIVWTWHIWITDQPGEYTYENGKVFLDRNIGALSAEMVPSEMDNYGFVYQWGRKDPFFGGDGEADETTTGMPIAVNNTIRNGTDWAIVNDNVSLRTAEGARKNPMMFLANNSSDEYADWLSVSDPTRWSEDIKTDNDPCPFGYKVPSKSDLTSIHVENPTAAWYFENAGHKHWEYKFYVPEVTIWPAAGMRLGRSSFGGNHGGQLIYSGTDANRGRCFYWTSTPNVSAGASHRVYTRGTVLYSENEHGDNADAYSVRCVKMENP